jgi:ribonuclease-3|tara:strand:- start:1508 stop:2206 length:699 start_codon:yes stop_codon:yes gene_type:complete
MTFDIDKKELEDFQKLINYNFNNTNILKESLTHSSVRKKKGSDLERLEFLGDRVLGLAISEFLFLNYPNLEEGELSEKFSFLVQKKICAEVSHKINIERFLILGKSERKSMDGIKDSILADTIEAIIGAIFIDGNYKEAKNFTLFLWNDYLNDREINEITPSPKNLLQELLQSKKINAPKYKVLKIQGKDHNPQFTVAVKVDGYEDILGYGSSKKEAETCAANNFLDKINHE